MLPVMRDLAVVVACAVVAVASWASPARAQGVPCLLLGPHAMAVEHLSRNYQEHVVARGLAGGGKVLVEVTASETGSWTILFTSSGTRMTCSPASGQNWESVGSPEPGDLTRR